MCWRLKPEALDSIPSGTTFLSFPLPFQRSSDSNDSDYLWLDDPHRSLNCGGVPSIGLPMLWLRSPFFQSQLMQWNFHWHFDTMLWSSSEYTEHDKRHSIVVEMSVKVYCVTWVWIWRHNHDNDKLTTVNLTACLHPLDCLQHPYCLPIYCGFVRNLQICSMGACTNLNDEHSRRYWGGMSALFSPVPTNRQAHKFDYMVEMFEV